MIKLEYNLRRQFIKWFFEDAYPDVGSNRATTFLVNEKGQRDYWMEQGFNAGADAIMNETLAILGDWAAACEGLDPELITPAEIFDRAQENLQYYFERIKAKQ